MELQETLSSFPLATVALVAVVTILLIYILTNRNVKDNGPPKVRKRFPVFGHLPLLDVDIRKSFRRFRREYGDLYRLYFGNHSVVIVSGIPAIKTALIKNGDSLLDRPSMYLVDILTNKEGLVFTNGLKWKEHRRLVLSAFRHFSVGSTRVEAIIMDKMETFKESLEQTAGTLFDPTPDVSVFATNVMTALLMGKTYQKDDESFKLLIQNLESNMSNAAIAGVLNFFPLLANIPGDVFKLKDLLKSNRAIQYFVEDYLRDKDKSGDEDFAGFYQRELITLQSNGAETTLNDIEMTRVIVDILFAGADDMTTSIRWCLAALAACPDVQDQLRQQIQELVAKDTPLSYADRTKVPLIEAFYLEVLRYCNLAVPGLPRCTSRDISLGGYDVPADSMVFIDLDSVLMDKDVWEDPDVFRPDRHLDEQGKLVKHDGMMVFSLGKRNCVGEIVAKMELFLFIGELVRNFKISGEDDFTIEKVDGQFGLTHRPLPFRIFAEKIL